MRQRLLALVVVLLLSPLHAFAVGPDPNYMIPTNNDGSPIDNIVTARFNPDPAAVVIPLPNNLLLSGTTDLTLNPPVDDPTDVSDPFVALSTLDGWSTVAPWAASFTSATGSPLNPATVIPGASVRMFEVTLTGPGGGVTGIVRELVPGPGGEFVATVTGPVSDPTVGGPFDGPRIAEQVAIILLAPLKELTSYMVVMTDTISDSDGNNATPDQAYFISKRTQPLVDAQGNSTLPLLDDATAQTLEPLRQLTNSQLFAASGAGINPADVVLSWVATTQNITSTLGAMRMFVTAPGANVLVPTGFTTADVVPGLPGIADIWFGTLDVPYYNEPPSLANPLGPLNSFWKAPPCGASPVCGGLGLDPTSTNLTFVNPIPVPTMTATIPVLLTVPNAGSGMMKPMAGWPVVIWQHPLGADRSTGLLIADTLASLGFAVIAIDHALHGITDTTNPLYAGNTPFPGDVERTFDVDYTDNATGAFGPDGLIDPSGRFTIFLGSTLSTLGNARQIVADLFVLAATIPTITFPPVAKGDDPEPFFDASRMHFVGMSLGALAGVPFLALEPTVTTGTINVGGCGYAGILTNSPSLTPLFDAFLLNAAGLEPGSEDYNAFYLAFQTIIDSADCVNYSAMAGAGNAILGQEVLGDETVPNFVPTFPLSGTEPMFALMGLTGIDSTTTDISGIRAAVRFISGSHSSLLSPAADPAVTAEMQGEMASITSTDGTTVVIADPSVVLPVAKRRHRMVKLDPIH